MVLPYFNLMTATAWVKNHSSLVDKAERNSTISFQPQIQSSLEARKDELRFLQPRVLEGKGLTFPISWMDGSLCHQIIITFANIEPHTLLCGRYGTGNWDGVQGITTCYLTPGTPAINELSLVLSA